MHTVQIKPISLNHAYRGRRFATDELKRFKRDLGRLLPRTLNVEANRGQLRVSYEFGVSSKSCDGDNLIKVFQDTLASFYGFNDRQIYEWSVKKVDVSKGDEYITFEIIVIQ